MSAETITIDGRRLAIQPGQTILDVARAAGLDIPTLCYLEKCGPLTSCLVCLVKVDGKLIPSCGTKVRPGMAVESETEEVHEARRTALELLFSDHVGDCLAPCQLLCPLGMNVPTLLRQVKNEEMPQATQTVRSALPLAGVLGRLCHHPCEQGCRRGHWDSPSGIRDIERHVAESGGEDSPFADQRGKATRSEVVIVGAGPAGLSAAFFLARYGHSVTVFDRNARAGGRLRDLPADELPAEVLEREIRILRSMGVRFEFGVELGSTRTISDLSAEFKAVLIAVGEPGDQQEKLGLPFAAGRVQADPHTSLTPIAQVFATGAAVRPTRQLVRVMAEGKAAAECVHKALIGESPRTPGRPFSSVMGRVSQNELKQFLSGAGQHGSVSPCDRCAGMNRPQAVSEASRCLHCDCRSSGNCLLQHYAQAYHVDAGRFRSERRPFEQQVQPGGVLFEPGKCIVCGICVKITELAAEPLGLTFIGRGFDVRVAAPLNHTIEEGLRKTAAECVEHCPTGALLFEGGKSSPPRNCA